MFGLDSDPDLFPETVRSGEPLVTVNGLKTYYDTDGFASEPVRAVDGVDLEIRKGETMGLVGESGCGKTTLGRTLIGLESATAGTVRSQGTEVTSLSGKALRRWQRNATLVFQDPESSLNDRMTVGEIVREPLDAHGLGTPDERRDRVSELLAQVGLNEEHYYRYPHQFSGGQRQRIGIARALVLEPDFVVLDEPVSALDVSVQARIINLLERLQDEFNLTYLFIAHDLSVVRHIADRVAVMYLGNIVERGAKQQVFETPAHPYTESLLSAVPGDRARGDAGSDRPRITLRGTPPNPRDPPEGCPFSTRCPAKIRPEEPDLPEKTWAAIDEFRTLLRARARRDSSVVAVIARRLGVSEESSVDIAVDELFGGCEMPSTVDDAIARAADLAGSDRDREAAELLRKRFGSVCDRDHPDLTAFSAGEGHDAACLRLGDDYEDVKSVLQRRYPDGRSDPVVGEGSPSESRPASRRRVTGTDPSEGDR